MFNLEFRGQAAMVAAGVLDLFSAVVGDPTRYPLEVGNSKGTFFEGHTDIKATQEGDGRVVLKDVTKYIPDGDGGLAAFKQKSLVVEMDRLRLSLVRR